MKHLEQDRIGGAEDLPERVVHALVAYREDTGRPPSARRYQIWRDALPVEERLQMPSLTAIVPIAYPSWEAARKAAGLGADMEEPKRASTHGPPPKWTAEQCLALVGEWLDEGGSGTIAAFSIWVDGQRAGGRSIPSVSTIRLRLRRPWSSIRDQAARGGTG